MLVNKIFIVVERRVKQKDFENAFIIKQFLFFFFPQSTENIVKKALFLRQE